MLHPIENTPLSRVFPELGFIKCGDTPAKQVKDNEAPLLGGVENLDPENLKGSFKKFKKRIQKNKKKNIGGANTGDADLGKTI